MMLKCPKLLLGACWVLGSFSNIVEDIACYAGFLLAPAECFGPVFFALGERIELFMLFLLILGHFLCSVLTQVTFSSNHRNFEKNQNNSNFFFFFFYLIKICKNL